MENKCTKEMLLPVSVIVAASKGDIEAMGRVLKHYDRYILKLSLRPIYDEYGNKSMQIDETIRQRLQTKLIEAVLKFKVV